MVVLKQINPLQINLLESDAFRPLNGKVFLLSHIKGHRITNLGIRVRD
jgi:hypothetical protein